MTTDDDTALEGKHTIEARYTVEEIRLLAMANTVFKEISMYEAICDLAQRHGCDLEINRAKERLGQAEGRLDEIIERAADLGFDPDTLQEGVELIVEVQQGTPCALRVASCSGTSPRAAKSVGTPRVRAAALRRQANYGGGE